LATLAIIMRAPAILIALINFRHCMVSSLNLFWGVGRTAAAYARSHRTYRPDDQPLAFLETL
jgi:hypothetical protein